MRDCRSKRWGVIAAVAGVVILVGASGCRDVTSLDRPLTVDWARTLTEGSGFTYFDGVAVDDSGNVYAAGRQGGDGTYGYGDGVESAGSSAHSNVLLVKYNANGIAQWARTLTEGSGSASFMGVAADDSGNVYAAGSQSIGAYGYGDDVSATNGGPGHGVVLVKYNSAGVAQWARTVTAGASAAYFDDVAVDGAGSVYAAGRQWGDGTYGYGDGVTAVGSSTSSNVLLVKYDGSGVAQWARTLAAGSGEASFYAIGVDDDGNVYAAGYQDSDGTYGYGNGVTAAAGSSSYSSVVVKYNAAGVAQWARTVTAGGYSQFFGVAVDGSGNVYATGRQRGDGTYDYGDGVSIAGPIKGDNAVLVKYNAAGVTQWARTVITGSDGAWFRSVAVDDSGSVYAAGRQRGAGTFDYSVAVSATGSSAGDNVVLVKYNANGAVLRARTLTAGSSSARFEGVVVDDDGNVYAVGLQEDTGTYGYGDGVSAAGSSADRNVVLVKYLP